MSTELMSTPIGPHFTDADVVRHIDREGDAAERDRRDRHLSGCDACAAQVDELREQSRLVSEWLGRADEPAAGVEAARPAGADTTGAVGAHEAVAPRGIEWRPTTTAPRRAVRSAVTPWLRAAAVILLLVTPAVAIPGVRDWVAGVIGQAEEEPARAVEALAAPQPHVVRFVPAPGRFTVRIDAAAPGSLLTLGRREAGDAAAPGEAILSHPPAAEPVVSRQELRIRPGDGTLVPPPDGAPSQYALRLPASVTSVRLVIGGGGDEPRGAAPAREIILGASELDAGRTITVGG